MTLGQFGSSSDTARNEAIFRTFSVGGSLARSDRFSVGLDANYTRATDRMDAIDLSAAADILAKLPHSTYDFSEFHLYSNLNTDTLQLTLRGEARLTPRLSGTFSASTVDVTDNTPYLADLTGTLTFYTVGLRWAF